MNERIPNVVNVDEVEAKIDEGHGEHYGSTYKPLTPALDAKPGALGMNLCRLPPGRAGCPFHTHQLEDEVFFIMSGTGVLRYGDTLQPLRAGDCISCPAGTGTAHQIANTGDEDLVYLAIGRNDPNEVATYPDSGKVLVRALGTVGVLERTDYYDGEPDEPPIFGLALRRWPAG
jgi:uncharacterized cupin superfamily protein